MKKRTTIMACALMLMACVPAGQKYEILNAEFGRLNAGFYTFGADYDGVEIRVNISGHTSSPFPGTYKVYFEMRNREYDSVRFDPIDMWLDADDQAYTLEDSYADRCCDGQIGSVIIPKGAKWWCTLYFANRKVEKVANEVKFYLGDLTVGESGNKISVDVIHAGLQEHRK